MEKKGLLCVVCHETVEIEIPDQLFSWEFENGDRYTLFPLLGHYLEEHMYLPPDSFLRNVGEQRVRVLPGEEGYEQIGNMADSYRFNLYYAKFLRQYPAFEETMKRLLEETQHVLLGIRSKEEWL